MVRDAAEERDSRVFGRREQRNRQREAWERHERDKRLTAEILADEQRQAEEREREAERRRDELAARDAQARRLAYNANEKLGRARREADDAAIQFEVLASELALGRVEEEAVLAARGRRERACARLEMWELAAAAIGGSPAVVGRR